MAMLSNDKINELIIDYRENNNQFAIEEIYKSYQKLITNLSNKYSYLKNIDYEGEVNFAFAQAIKTYNPDKKILFNTYLKSCIDNRIKVKITEQKAYKRKTNQDTISYDTPINEDDENNGLQNIIEDTRQNYNKIEFDDTLERAKAFMSNIERDIFELCMKGETLKDISIILNIPISLVSNSIQNIRKNKTIRNLLQIDNRENRFLIVDGTYFAMRAICANSDLQTKSGFKTGYIYLFLSMFKKMLKITNPTHLVICWDIDRYTWRKEIYSEYKSNRGESDKRTKIGFKLIRDILETANILNVEFEKYESDDLCGTFANKSIANKTYIATGDTDLYQLIDDNTFILFSDYEKIGIEEIQQKYNINPNQYVFFKTLTGDKSDNIPGIYGISEKGASRLVNIFGDFNTFLKEYNNSDKLSFSQKQKIKEWTPNAKKYYKLVGIKKNIPIEYDMNDCVNNINWHNCESLFKKYEFKSLDVNTMPIGTQRKW